jgi:hypothetical protein
MYMGSEVHQLTQPYEWIIFSETLKCEIDYVSIQPIDTVLTITNLLYTNIYETVGRNIEQKSNSVYTKTLINTISLLTPCIGKLNWLCFYSTFISSLKDFIRAFYETVGRNIVNNSHTSFLTRCIGKLNIKVISLPRIGSLRPLRFRCRPRVFWRDLKKDKLMGKIFKRKPCKN